VREITCNSAYRLHICHLNSRKKAWFTSNEPTYMVMGNARGHGMKEAVEEYKVDVRKV
jgi:hypothetical protein